MNDMIDSTKENISWIKPIKNNDDFMITNTGAIWSRVNNRWLKPFRIDNKGHLQVYLSVGNEPYIHRLVFETFVRPLKKGEVVHHLDQDPTNNLYTNLVAMTQAEHTLLHRKGRNHSQQTKRKMSLAKKGKRRSQQIRLKISEGHKGIKHSEETKQKMSLSHKRKEYKQ